MNKPCLHPDCGEPSPGSYCDEHQPKPWQHREGSSRARGYDAAWNKLSRRARKMQPFCTDCGATDDLQLDHTARTWERVDAGKVVRLRDTGGVVCGPCNRRRGAGRGRETHGEGPIEASKRPREKARSPLHKQPLDQGHTDPDQDHERARGSCLVSASALSEPNHERDQADPHDYDGEPIEGVHLGSLP